MTKEVGNGLGFSFYVNNVFFKQPQAPRVSDLDDARRAQFEPVLILDSNYLQVSENHN